MEQLYKVPTAGTFEHLIQQARAFGHEVLLIFDHRAYAEELSDKARVIANSNDVMLAELTERTNPRVGEDLNAA